MEQEHLLLANILAADNVGFLSMVEVGVRSYPLEIFDLESRSKHEYIRYVDWFRTTGSSYFPEYDLYIPAHLLLYHVTYRTLNRAHYTFIWSPDYDLGGTYSIVGPAHRCTIKRYSQRLAGSWPTALKLIANYMNQCE